MTAREIRLQPWETRLEEFYTQQCGMALDTLIKAAGKGTRRGYSAAKRLKEAGRAHVLRIDYGTCGPWRNSANFDAPGAEPHGPLWIYPQPHIARGLLEFDPGEWEPKASTAAHLTALSELRLALTGLETDPEVWTSERILRHRLRAESGQPGGHVHDAWFQDLGDPDKVWAIEVELSRKRGAGRLMAAMARAVDAAERHELAGVLYFVRGDSLRQAVEATATRLAHKRGLEQLPNLEIHDLDTTLSKKGVH